MRRTLSLTKETLSSLTAEDLAAVVGAGITDGPGLVYLAHVRDAVTEVTGPRQCITPT